MRITDYTHLRRIRLEGAFEGGRPQLSMIWIALAGVVVPAAIVGVWKPVHISFYVIWAIGGLLVGQFIWALGGDRRCTTLDISNEEIRWSDGESEQVIPTSSVTGFEIDFASNFGDSRTDLTLRIATTADVETRERPIPMLALVGSALIRAVSRIDESPREHPDTIDEPALHDQVEGRSETTVSIGAILDWIEDDEWPDLARRCGLILGLPLEQSTLKRRRSEFEYSRTEGATFPPVTPDLPSYGHARLAALTSMEGEVKSRHSFSERPSRVKSAVECAVVATFIGLQVGWIPRWTTWPQAILTILADLALASVLAMATAFTLGAFFRHRSRLVELRPETRTIRVRDNHGEREIPFDAVQRVVLVRSTDSPIVLETRQGSLELPGSFVAMKGEKRAAIANQTATVLGVEAVSYQTIEEEEPNGDA